MPTVPPSSPAPPPREPHRAREVAESFGADPERYDRARPRYPQALVDRILAGSPGPDVLDVGIGTGICARPFRAAGATVLGVEVDPRMARFARRQGFAVEVAAFERWDAAGRTFDAIIAGMSWHWVDPIGGAVRAAELLRPGGRLDVFWSAALPPPALARAFAEVYRRVAPDAPFAAGPADPLQAYAPILDAAAAGIRAAGAFAEPERWRVDSEHPYTTAEWLDVVPTFGGHSRLTPDTLGALLAGIGDAIDAHGGRVTMRYVTVAVTAATTGATA